ncbi:hypothetical protein RB595_008580 [Gaeumannomyces hyphopodioides]
MTRESPRISKLALLALAGVVGQAHGAYVWPSRFDVLEDMLAMQGGIWHAGFTDVIIPCGASANQPGIQKAAEWVRTAFHDMATHDAAAGTGGLDASIMYEVSRPENEGDAFDHTLGDLAEFVTPEVSASDLIALGLVASMASCGGLKIPYRAGRVDATAAGPPGVPQPTDPLDKMVAAFDRMGFTRSEMIGLVACGHSIGQVHSVDFPDLVQGAPAPTNVATFDRTPHSFDTAVVDEYLSGDGVNPLVFGANETTNSDKRVFGADGNVTMRALADPASFASTCTSLLGRMINTVPRDVRLTEPIELQEIKPYVEKLQLDAGSSTVLFQGRVRVHTTGRNADALSVALDVADRDGGRSDVPATRVRLRGGQSFGFFNEQYTWFDFSAQLPADAAISSFNIKVTNATTNSTTTYDNNGAVGGYPVQSDLLLLQGDSCLNTNIVNGNMTVRVTAAVRSGAGGKKCAAAPVVNMAHRVQQPNVTLARLVMEKVKMKPLNVTRGPYQLYAADVPLEPKSWSTTFNIALPRAAGDLVSALFKTNSLSTDC